MLFDVLLSAFPHVSTKFGMRVLGTSLDDSESLQSKGTWRMPFIKIPGPLLSARHPQQEALDSKTDPPERQRTLREHLEALKHASKAKFQNRNLNKDHNINQGSKSRDRAPHGHHNHIPIFNASGP